MNPEEAERQVLNALLGHSNEPLAYAHHVRRLSADHFLQRRFGSIYAAMLALSDETGGYDQVSVIARAERDGLPNAAAVVAELAALPPNFAEFKRHVAIVLDAAMDRTLRIIATEIAGNDDPADRAERAIAALMETLDTTIRRRPKLVGGPLAAAVDKAAQKREKDLSGVPSGFRLLDKLTGGWQKENLIVVAARPGMGKSAFALQCATHAARQGHAVGMWTLEMSDEELARRMLASSTGVSVSRMKRGGLSTGVLRDMLDAARQDAQIPLWVDDVTDLSIAELRAKARRLHQRQGLELVIVDYLQLMRMDPGVNRNQAVGEITRGLKVLASELEVPVIALSQLSRDVEKRAATAAGKKPVLSDLRDSGQIEQDANVVIFPFREGAYDRDCLTPNLVELLVPKNRDGATADAGDITLTWVGEAMRFDD